MRRAWIEMVIGGTTSTERTPSPSVRRAWIEIAKLVAFVTPVLVALREEGVD